MKIDFSILYETAETDWGEREDRGAPVFMPHSVSPVARERVESSGDTIMQDRDVSPYSPMPPQPPNPTEICNDANSQPSPFSPPANVTDQMILNPKVIDWRARRAGEVSENNPGLWKQLYRLFDQSDDCERRGDTPGMVRVLGEIDQLLLQQSPAQAMGVGVATEPFEAYPERAAAGETTIPDIARFNS